MQGTFVEQHEHWPVTFGRRNGNVVRPEQRPQISYRYNAHLDGRVHNNHPPVPTTDPFQYQEAPRSSANTPNGLNAAGQEIPIASRQPSAAGEPRGPRAAAAGAQHSQASGQNLFPERPRNAPPVPSAPAPAPADDDAGTHAAGIPPALDNSQVPLEFHMHHGHLHTLVEEERSDGSQRTAPSGSRYEDRVHGHGALPEQSAITGSGRQGRFPPVL